MMITKRFIPRRALLRGGGVAIAMPLLDAMVPALTATRNTAAAPVSRIGFIYVPNGMAQNDIQTGGVVKGGVNHWLPTGVGADFEMSPILAPLAPLRDHLVVLSGLDHASAVPAGDGNGDHSRATSSWLNGRRPKKTESGDLQAGRTIDQIIAGTLGRETSLPSIELIASDVDAMYGTCENGYSCAYVNSVSWRSSSVPVPMDNNPRSIFERLFGDGGTAEERARSRRSEQSVLDLVSRRTAALNRSLGPADRARLGEYLDSIREVERRIQNAEARASQSPAPLQMERPVGIPTTFQGQAEVMFDLLALAFQADVTRCFTFMLGREFANRTFPEIGINEPHHAVSHHGNNLDQIAKLLKINVLQTQLFTRFLDKLRTAREGDSTVFGRSLFMYGAGLGNPNDHIHLNLPTLLAGGPLRGGRHLVFAPRTPLANLFVNLFEKLGVPPELIGDATGPLVPEPLAGL